MFGQGFPDGNKKVQQWRQWHQDQGYLADAAGLSAVSKWHDQWQHVIPSDFELITAAARANCCSDETITELKQKQFLATPGNSVEFVEYIIQANMENAIVNDIVQLHTEDFQGAIPWSAMRRQSLVIPSPCTQVPFHMCLEIARTIRPMELNTLRHECEIA